MTATRTSYASERLASIAVGEVMRAGVLTCPPTASISAVAAMMVAHDIHAVVVCAAPDHAPLVVTDLDLVAGAVHHPGATAWQLAGDPAASVSIDAPLSDAVALMSTRSVSHLLAVAPDSGAAAGVLSTLDLAAVAAGMRPDLVRAPRPAPARPSSSARRLDRARVGDLMHAGITTCAPEAPIAAVARIMADHHTHCAAVAGIDAAPGREQRLTWGLIDDLDLLGALHRDELDCPASSIADTVPLAVRESDSMALAAALMVEHQRRHLVAVGTTRLASGIVSTLDVARVLATR